MEKIRRIEPLTCEILLNTGANKENYGSFHSLFFGFQSLNAQKDIQYLKNIAILVKRQVLPDGGIR